MPEILHLFTPQLGKLAQRPPATSPCNLKIFQSQGGSAGPWAGTVDVRPKNAELVDTPPSPPPTTESTWKQQVISIVWVGWLALRHPTEAQKPPQKLQRRHTKFSSNFEQFPSFSDFQISGICSNAEKMVHLKLKLKEIIKYQGDYFTIPPILGDD